MEGFIGSEFFLSDFSLNTPLGTISSFHYHYMLLSIIIVAIFEFDVAYIYLYYKSIGTNVLGCKVIDF